MKHELLRDAIAFIQHSPECLDIETQSLKSPWPALKFKLVKFTDNPLRTRYTPQAIIHELSGKTAITTYRENSKGTLTLVNIYLVDTHHSVTLEDERGTNLSAGIINHIIPMNRKLLPLSKTFTLDFRTAQLKLKMLRDIHTKPIAISDRQATFSIKELTLTHEQLLNNNLIQDKA